MGKRYSGNIGKRCKKMENVEEKNHEKKHRENA